MRRLTCIVLIAVLCVGSSFTRFAERKDPHACLTAPEIIEANGYQADEYTVETADGYLLTLHRVRSKSPPLGCEGRRKVVLLQHGLLDSSHTWINNLPHQSLAFILADADYDVWLGNSRGNAYSQRHAHLDPANDQFWRFSWDEMVEYDLPRVVDFIIEETRAAKIFYVGHSEGAQIMLVRLNKDPRMRGQVAAVAALSPLTYLNNVTSPFHRLAPLCLSLPAAYNFLGSCGRFVPSEGVKRFLAQFTSPDQSSPPLNHNIFFLLSGADAKNMNATRLSMYVESVVAATSVQNMVHHSQGLWHGRFEAFDFGEAGNMAKYGRTTPPPYGLDAVRVPVTLYFGGRDQLSTASAARRFAHELTRCAASNVHVVYVADYNHYDFVWSLDAHSCLYKSILDFFERVH